MNFLRMLPKPIRTKLEDNMTKAGVKNPAKKFSSNLITSVLFSLVISLITYFFGLNPFYVLIALFILMQLFFYFKISLEISARVKKAENVFPDVIQLMSSNLRAGMTVDKAFIYSSRPEFSPLDEEIMKAGKEIVTGKDVASAFLDLSRRIGSEKIEKIIRLVITGIKSGGNISTLLEQTAGNMREKEFVEKRAASNILMYVIFIFFAVAVGAPLLFGLSSVLVEVILKIGASLPSAEQTAINLPITFSSINVSPAFVIYFSLVFLVVTTVISSLVIGLVNKGSEKEGLKYLIPLVAISIAIFFVIRAILGSFLANTIPIP